MFCKFSNMDGKLVYVRRSTVHAFVPSNNYDGSTVIMLSSGKEVTVKDSIEEVAKQVDGIFALVGEKQHEGN